MAGEKNNAPGRPGPGERAGKAAAAEPETAAPAASGSAAQAAAFEDLDAALGAGEGESADTAKMDLVLDIPIRLSVELGRTDIPIRDVLHLGRGSMVELDRGPGAPLDVRVNAARSWW